MTAENTFNFELVSPDKKLLSEQAYQVTIPGEDGTFGVRAGHMSLVASIRAGVVEVVSEAGKPAKKIFIAGGFADVTATNCTVLAEEAVNVADLLLDKIEGDIKNLTEDLSAAKTELDKVRLTRALTLAKAKRSAVTGSLAA